MAKQKNQTENVFFQQKWFWSEPKTFASFSDISFVKKNMKETSGETQKAN